MRSFYICQIQEKKLEYGETVHQLFKDFKKAYDSVRRKVLYSILIGFGEPTNLVQLVCYIATAFQHCFRIHHWESPGKPNGSHHQLLVHADDVYLLGDNMENIKTVQKN
jgi:hypothetical protein